MNIGDKILVNGQVSEITEISNVVPEIPEITEISNVVPVQYKDDGNETWYEVCDAMKSDQRLVTMKNTSGNEINIIINKESESMQLLLDLL